MMYSRFKSGLIQPQNLGLYLKDSWIKVWSYFFLLICIFMIPFIVVEFQQKGLRSDQLSSLYDRYQSSFVGPYQITDGKLSIPAENLIDQKYIQFDFYTIGLLNAPRGLDDRTIEVTFLSEGIRYGVLGNEVAYYSYSGLGLGQFDFNDYSFQNKAKLVGAINQVFIENDGTNKTIQIFIYFFISFIEVIFLVLLAALFTNPKVPYKLRFKIAIYAATIYIFLNLFSMLFGVELLSLVGVILLLVYVHRAMRQLVVV